MKYWEQVLEKAERERDRRRLNFIRMQKPKYTRKDNFKDIPGYPGYKVNKDGVVKSGNKILKASPHTRGYLQVSLAKDGETKAELVHRLVLMTWDKPCPEGMECHHINKDKQDNRIENLRWVTHKENMQDRNDSIVPRRCKCCHELKPLKSGQKFCSINCRTNYFSGERHLRAKLTEKEIREIRWLRDGGVPGTIVAEGYGLKPSTVCDIYKRRSWAHIY